MLKRLFTPQHSPAFTIVVAVAAMALNSGSLWTALSIAVIGALVCSLLEHVAVRL